MKRTIILLFLFTISWTVMSQEKHDHPDHPKGNSAQMYVALPFYNEACELYELGDTVGAKRLLKEAISVSFELTEAHLFLGDIYYVQHLPDSALYYYKSGIDFAIEQKPYYFFRLFEVAFQLGQYDILKQNMKYFHQQYKNQGGDAPYEEGWPFMRSDYEFYEKCIQLVYDYKNWKQMAFNVHEISLEHDALHNAYDAYWLLKDGHLTALKAISGRPNKTKKIHNLPFGIESFFEVPNQKLAIFSGLKNDTMCLFIGEIKGRKIADVKAIQGINKGSWQGSPYFSTVLNKFYFSSNVHGQKDLFVCDLNLDTGDTKNISALDRINTSGDEFGLWLSEELGKVYFISDGYPGFGGTDVFFCNDYEVIDGAWFPINPRNMGATTNSNQHEVYFQRKNDTFLFTRNQSGKMRTFQGEWHEPIEVNFDIVIPEVQTTTN